MSLYQSNILSTSNFEATDYNKSIFLVKSIYQDITGWPDFPGMRVGQYFTTTQENPPRHYAVWILFTDRVDTNNAVLDTFMSRESQIVLCLVFRI